MTENFIHNFTLAFFICFFLFLNSCTVYKENTINPPIPPKTEGLDCQADTDCVSGVCNFIKQAIGQCMPAQCSTSEQALGINGQTSFYCDHNNQWQKIKGIGETCTYDYQCVQITCKDNPSCHPGDYKYSCQNHICLAEPQPNECSKQGLVRIPEKEAFTREDGTCIEIFLEQREEPTVCAPCGNGICDLDLENKCNCPTDCN